MKNVCWHFVNGLNVNDSILNVSVFRLFFFIFEQLSNVRKPISIMFKIEFTSYYLVITRKDLVITRKLSRNYEKIIS